ncbi:hypothetical protein GCM10022395_02770 [Snuella lapsa]|uniref:Outer membrane protein beta-barrel domain-containing protein n=2 Tax=Snuella lapsa TaxID=870481 RepID=A0ABP6WQ93_9FLAO
MILITLVSFSQIDYGANLGINSSRFSNKFNTIGGEYLNTSSLGLSIGIFAEIPLSDKISFYPKLLFNQMGDRDKSDIDYLVLDSVDYKLDYISIPLNFKFFNKPYLFIGPQLGLLVSYKAESMDIGKPNSSFDFGGNFGTGYAFNDFRLELAIYQSIIDVLKAENTYGGKKLNIRNTYINFNFSYIISNR